MEIDEELPTSHMKPPRVVSALGLSIVLSLIAAGLSYYAFQLWSEDQRTSAKLAKVNTQVKTLERERAAHVKKVAELEQTGSEQHERLTQNDADLVDVKQKLAAAESRLGELQSEREELSARVAEFKRVSQQFQRMIDSGKLSVSFRRGRMIVELPATVLFASGSAELSPDGQSALKDVAKILRQVPGKHFIVGGHTDDVPISKAQGGYSSNWALSAARAVTVTEALLDAGVKPTRLTASGFGPYDPIASNSSAKGRQKNRRIEIVLEPDLRELPASLHDNKAKASSKKGAAKKGSIKKKST
jgi:chemotaxis protein MotB